MEKLEKIWIDDFKKEGIWPQVLDWTLYSLSIPLKPVGIKGVEPVIYKALVVVGTAGSPIHSLHLRLTRDDAWLINGLYCSLITPFSKTVMVKDVFECHILVGFDEKEVGDVG